MKVLEALWTYRHSDRTALIGSEGCLSYRELWERSENLAYWIRQKYLGNRAPIVVYGHKSPWMIIAFLACVKSGHAYVPVDISVPANRVETIIRSVHPPVILAAAALRRRRNMSVYIWNPSMIGLQKMGHMWWIKKAMLKTMMFFISSLPREAQVPPKAFR